MNDYTEVRLDLNPCTETHTDILAAMLAEPIMKVLYRTAPV